MEREWVCIIHSYRMKQEIRDEMLAKRKGMNAADLHWRNEEICTHLRLSDAFVNAKRVMFYLPIQNEVDVTPLLKNVSIKKLLPYVEGNMIKASYITDIDDVVPGAYGTKEPRVKDPEEHINIVLVPGLAFDRNRNRLGYGQGYYDRFLSCTTALKIGLAYQLQIIPQVPTEPHDVQMDMIITEEGIIQ